MSFYIFHVFMILLVVISSVLTFPFSQTKNNSVGENIHDEELHGDEKIRNFLHPITKEPSTSSVPDPQPDDMFLRVGFPSLFNVTPIKPVLDNELRPSCAKSIMQTFCDSRNVPDYPEDEIRKLVHYDQTQFSELFGLGANTGESITLRRSDNGIKEMTDNEDEYESNICEMTSTVFYPRAARNKDKEWVYVVNDAEYIQAVTSDKCTSEGTACNYLTDSLPFGWKSKCRQKYSYKKLLAVSPMEKKTYTDFFPIPSCCTCYVSGDIDSRKISRRTTRAPKNAVRSTTTP